MRRERLRSHPRDPHGRETLDPVIVDGVVGPDYASVNVSQDGSEDVMAVLLGAGIGIEAGVWSVEDAKRLARSGFADRVTRILVEPVDVGAEEAAAVVDGIHAALDGAGIEVPRLQHGDGRAAWVLFEDAIRRRIDTRVGSRTHSTSRAAS
jgi:hypothetical protein